MLEFDAKYEQTDDKKRRRVEFEVGYFVLVKDPFSVGDYKKLSTWKIRLVEIMEKINSNAYHLKFPTNIQTAGVFNVKYLIFFSDR